MSPRPDLDDHDQGRAPGARLRDGAYGVLAIGSSAVTMVSVLRATAAGGVVTDRLFSSSDDAFYYFAIASRWARGEGSTFDGIQATNGYQPLWFWINAAIFRLIGSDTAAVVTVVGLTCALWCVAVALARAIARELDAGWAGVLGVAAVALVTYRTWFAGMEFALAGTLLLVVVWFLLRGHAFRPAGPTRSAAVALGVVGALATLARLDIAAVVLVVAAAVVLSSREATPRKRVCVAALLLVPTAIVLTVYLALNAVVFDSAVPMSGRAKQLGGNGLPRWADLTDYLALTLGGRVRFLGTLLALGLAVALTLLRRSKALRERAVRRSTLTRLLVLLAAAQVAQLAYYAAASSWDLESWYYTLTVPLVFLITVVLTLAASTAAGSRRPTTERPRGTLPDLQPTVSIRTVSIRTVSIRTVSIPTVPLPAQGPPTVPTRERAERRRLLAGVTALAVALLVVGRAGLEEARTPLEPDPGSQPIAATVATARWVDASLPPDARLAMGDWAGAFGFTASHPVLQTEGLVGSRAYLDALDRGEGGRFLADAGVGYFVKIGSNGEIAQDGACRIYGEPVYGAGPTMTVRVCDDDLVHRTPGPPGQGDVRVWRVTPTTWAG